MQSIKGSVLFLCVCVADKVFWVVARVLLCNQ